MHLIKYHLSHPRCEQGIWQQGCYGCQVPAKCYFPKFVCWFLPDQELNKELQMATWREEARPHRPEVSQSPEKIGKNFNNISPGWRKGVGTAASVKYGMMIEL